MKSSDTEGYVLHARAYGETSLLLDLFTVDYGRLSAVARGARSARHRSLLQPFNCLQLSLVGRGDLKTLKSCENNGPAGMLAGDQLLLGLYANELLVRLLGRFERLLTIYVAYASLLKRLESAESDAELALRLFEFTLLQDLDYGVSFSIDLHNDNPIVPGKHYRFLPEQGFVETPDAGPECYAGADVLRASRNDFNSVTVRRLTRNVARVALGALLGDRPLNSRQLFSRKTAAPKHS